MTGVENVKKLSILTKKLGLVVIVYTVGYRANW